MDQLAGREAEGHALGIGRGRPVGEAAATETTTSAEAVIWLPQVVPVWPTAPMNNSLSSAMAPLPFQVIDTAAPSFSASAVNSCVAFA